MEGHRRVCVTGASGYCGSWLVKHLLERGYNVRATVRDPEDKAKTAHLKALTMLGQSERLEIVKGDLLDEHDFEVAVRGCDGVFHVASPVVFDSSDSSNNPEPERDVIYPAVEGTLNVLKACARSPSVKRVVHTSSVVAVLYSGKDTAPDQVLDESSWTSIEFCRHEKVRHWPYIVSKTLAEQKALEFANEKGIELVTILPSFVVGPFITPEIPTTVLGLITGEEKNWFKRMPYTHVDDLAMAHIFLFEHPTAEGRYICSTTYASNDEIEEMLSRIHPELIVSRQVLLSVDDNSGPLLTSSERLKKLGFQFKYSIEDMFRDAIQQCKQRGISFQMHKTIENSNIIIQ